jgi:hypothetical protein
MTDKIDELFTQAGGYIEIDKDGNRMTYSHECDPDTFASLIIEECIRELTDSFDMTVETGNQLRYHFWGK